MMHFGLKSNGDNDMEIFDKTSMDDKFFNEIFCMGTKFAPFVYRYILKRVDFNGTNGTLALDIGTGNGGIAIQLKKKGFDVIGIDLSRDMLLRGNGAAVQGDGCRLPFKDGTFNLIVSHWCLHHVPKLPEFFKECNRVVKKGGTILLSDFREMAITPILRDSKIAKRLVKLPMLNELLGTGMSLRHTQEIKKAIDKANLNWQVTEGGIFLYITNQRM